MHTTIVAIDCTNPQLLAYQQQFADLKMVDELHLTLAFLGKIEHSAPVHEQLKKVRAKSFSITTTTLATFSNPQQTQLCMLELKHNKLLHTLQQKIIRALNMQAPQFKPHITVARSNKPINLYNYSSPLPITLSCRTFHLYEKQNNIFVKTHTYKLT